MVYRGEGLKAQIKATNLANEVANDLLPRLTAIFAPLVGQKIFRDDGELMVKFQKLVPDLPNSPNLRVYMSGRDYSLAWTVSACRSYTDDSGVYGRGREGNVRAEAGVYIGQVRNCILTELYKHDKQLRTDYDYDTIVAARKAAKEAKRVYDEASGKCSPFGDDC